MALNPGTATQLSEQLRKLADYGASKKPPADSALAQFVADTRAYADYLTAELGPVSGGVVIQPDTDVFHTADALAQGIIDEAGGPPPPELLSGTFPWALGALGLGGLLAYACVKQRRGLFSQGRRRGVLAVVGL